MPNSAKFVEHATNPFQSPGEGWKSGGVWPAMWVTHPDASPASGPTMLFFELDLPAGDRRIHVSADQRYELFLGEFSPDNRFGVGPQRGHEKRWRFETYDLTIEEPTVLRVRVEWLGADAQVSQHSVRPALVVADDPGVELDPIHTGVAPWRARSTPLPIRLDEVTFGLPAYLDGATATALWGGGDWTAATLVGDVPGQRPRDHGRAISLGDDRNTASPWRLFPAELPPQHVADYTHASVVHVDDDVEMPVLHENFDLDRAAAWQNLISHGKPLTLGHRERVLVDLRDYACLRHRLTLGGAGTVDVRMSESLYHSDEADVEWWPRLEKRDREQLEGKRFFGVGDKFAADDSGLDVESPTWRAGRYVQLVATPGEGEELTLSRWTMREEHYPHAYWSRFSIADEPGPLLEALRPLCERCLRMNSHETYVDTPYYEVLQYIGDTRLQVLLTYALTTDDRLPRQAIRAFNDSRLTSGLTQSRFPTSENQIIPGFSLWWVAMVHDFAMWRDDAEFVKEQLVGVRGVLDAWLAGPPKGWMYLDWVTGWEAGVPPGGADGRDYLARAQLAHVLELAAELEDAFGEPEYHARWRRGAQAEAARVAEAWDDGKGLLISDGHRAEHGQILALLTPAILEALPDGAADKMWAALCDEAVEWDATASVYFSHYLFEACARRGDLTPLLRRLQLWQFMVDFGCKTTLESPEPSRSDCHAWAAHPLLHAFTTCLGVRPASFGFKSASVRPLVAGAGSMVHPKGTIHVDASDPAAPVIELPDGVVRA